MTSFDKFQENNKQIIDDYDAEYGEEPEFIDQLEQDMQEDKNNE